MGIIGILMGIIIGILMGIIGILMGITARKYVPHLSLQEKIKNVI